MMNRAVKSRLVRYLVMALSIFSLPSVVVHGEDEVTPFVEKYCRQEFDGVTEDRTERFVKFSPTRLKHEEATHEFSGRVILWDWDPLYVVDSFKVISIEINPKYKNKGTALIQYDRVARSDGKGVVVPDRLVNDRVTLNLIRDSHGWRVLDPPLPRVSRHALADVYQGILSRLDGRWLASASDEQLVYYRRIKRNTEVLANSQR